MSFRKLRHWLGMKLPDSGTNERHVPFYYTLPFARPETGSDMGHPINTEQTVGLTLIDPKTGEQKSIERANMTKENRQAINAALNRSEIGKPSN